MGKLQNEKEIETSNPKLSKLWVYNEVSNIKNIVRLGTLKTSCRDYIEKKLSILLAGIISYTDTNNNLDSLINKDIPEWTRQFWYGMFNNEEFIKLNYASYFLTANHVEKSEFNCIDYFLERKNPELGPTLPFSWLIIEYINELIKLQHYKLNIDFSQMNVVDVVTNPSEIYRQILHVFQNTLHYKSLTEISSNANKDELFDFYVNDFLLIIHPEIINKNHLNVVKKRIRKYIEQYYEKDFTSISVWIAVHLAFEDLRKELLLLAKFMQFKPELANTLEKNDQFENNMSYLAANIVCKDTASKISGDSGSSVPIEDWNKLFTDVESSSFLIEAFIKQFYTALNSSDSLINKDRLKEFKSLWERVTIARLFIEHVQTEVKKDMYTYCTRLWRYLKDPIDFKSSKTVEQLIKYIDNTSIGRKRLYEKEMKICKGCNYKFNVLHKSNICTETECVLCDRCVNDFKNTLKCKGCDTRYPNFDFTLFINVNKSKDEYIRFKTSLDTFFLDAICTMCLNDEYLPDKSILEMLINQILPKRIDQINSSNANNRGIPITDVDLELNTTIKSTLLQLLLKYNINEVVLSLDKLFSQSADYLTANYKQEDLTELNLMYINAIEDNFYTHEVSDDDDNKETNNIAHDANSTITLLDELFKIFDGKRIEIVNSESRVNNLLILAKMKFCFVTLSKLISLENYVKFTELFKLAQRFVENYYNEWPKFFLIKQIFRRRGQQILLNIVANNQFKWILPNNFNLEDETVISIILNF